MTLFTSLVAVLATFVPAQLEALERILPSPADGSAATARVESVDEATERTSDLAMPIRLWITSPWGYTDLYFIRPGRNVLYCSGTGLLFTYWF